MSAELRGNTKLGLTEFVLLVKGTGNFGKPYPPLIGVNTHLSFT